MFVLQKQTKHHYYTQHAAAAVLGVPTAVAGVVRVRKTKHSTEQRTSSPAKYTQQAVLQRHRPPCSGIILRGQVDICQLMAKVSQRPAAIYNSISRL